MFYDAGSTQEVLRKTQLEMKMMCEEKDDEITKYRLKIDSMGTQYESVLMVRHSSSVAAFVILMISTYGLHANIWRDCKHFTFRKGCSQNKTFIQKQNHANELTFHIRWCKVIFDCHVQSK